MLRDSKFVFLLSLILAGSMWFYMQHVVIGHQISEAKTNDSPRGNLSDLYPRWLGTREFLLHHRDPYGPDITREIQIGYYGRPLDPSRPQDPKDQQGFAYPLYVIFLLAPTIGLPFSAVRVGFFWSLMAATVISVLLWLRVLKWQTSCWISSALIVLTLGSFQVLQGLKLQQLTVLVGVLIAATVALVVAGRLTAAGILLALATIKPQLVVFLGLWSLAWALSDWPRRRNFVLGFGGALVLLVATAEYMMPGWIGQFRQSVAAYRQYNDGAFSILQVLSSPLWGSVLAALILLATARQCWRVLHVEADSVAFGWMTALVLAVTILVIPKTSPYNQILLLPGVLLIARHWRIALGESSVARLTFIISTFILFWPWLAALAITLILVLLPTVTLGNAWRGPVYTILAIPFAVCVLLAFNMRRLGESGDKRKRVPALG